jgi:uncharacterized protein (TIGR03437 family)
MSNTTMEFTAFLSLAQSDARRNPRVQPVDGAVGGRTAASIVSQPDTYWSTVEQRLASANASDAQVQVIWLKEADANPMQAFPAHAQLLQSEIQTMIQQAQARFPNLKIVYLSNRIYAGYASSTLNPEPYAYEGAFAVKWLIEQRINAVSQAGPTAFPWLAWGPYLWADGTTPRSDGLTWACSDVQASDGTHPSASGQQKVAAMLLDFFHTDPTARLWYVAAEADPAPKIAALLNSAGWEAPVANSSLATIFGTNLASGVAAAASTPLPHELAGAEVQIDGEPALLYYASPTQINFVLPVSGSSLSVVRGQTASAPWNILMGFWAPGLYTFDYLPTGPAAALHADGNVVTPANPARSGESVQLVGTGSGYVNPALAIAIPAPQVQIGGATVNANAGPLPGWPGLTQVTFTVPPVSKSAGVPVVFQLGPYQSNAATLAQLPQFES